jgi:hypothetical protein
MRQLVGGRATFRLMLVTDNKESHKCSCSSLGLREDVSKTGRFPRVKPADQVRDVTEAGTLQILVAIELR